MFRYPIYTTKYARSGVTPFVIDSAALKMNCEYCGDIFSCIIAGTRIGDIIIHFVIVLGTNRFDIAITMIATIISNVPDNGIDFSILDRNTTIMVPMFVSLNIAMNCEAKNIITSSIPRVLSLFVNFFISSLSFFIDFAPIAYAIPVTIRNSASIYVNPDSRYEFAPNN